MSEKMKRKEILILNVLKNYDSLLALSGIAEEASLFRHESCEWTVRFYI